MSVIRARLIEPPVQNQARVSHICVRVSLFFALSSVSSPATLPAGRVRVSRFRVQASARMRWPSC